MKPPVDFDLQICIVKHYITYSKKRLYELISVGIVPRKMQIYLYCLQITRRVYADK